MSKLGTKHDAYEALLGDILTLELAPGTALDEARLAARFNLSRTPMREVLQRLTGEGYVESQANRGSKVASMDLPTLRVFFQTAPLVYCSVARMAAEHRTQTQLDNLNEIQTTFMAALKNHDAAIAAIQNHRFHQKIGEMAANPYLMAALERMLVDHTRLSQTFYRPTSDTENDRVKVAGQHHDAMILALRAQDGEAAVDLTLKHWDLSRDRMERYVRPDPLPLEISSSTEREYAV